MATKLYISTASPSPRSALVRSSTSNNQALTPDIVVGDQLSLELYLVDGAGGYDAASGAGGYSVKLAVGIPGAAPTSGTYRLGYDGQSVTGVAVGDTAAQVQTKLESLSNLAPGDVVVTGAYPVYVVRFSGTLTSTDVVQIVGASESLSPAGAVVVSTIVPGGVGVDEQQEIRIVCQPAAMQTTWTPIANGWSGTLDANTHGIVQMLGSADTTAAVLEMEVTDGTGKRRTFLQAPLTIRNEAIDEASLVANPLDTYLTSAQTHAQFVQNRSLISGLTGGGASKLDGILTVGVAAGALVEVFDTGGAHVRHVYRLISSTQAETSPLFIRPDDYATTTNEKVWALVAVSFPDRTGSEQWEFYGTGGEAILWSGSADILKIAASGRLRTPVAPAREFVGCIFTQTASQAITNSTAESSLFFTGAGTRTLPANFWAIGKTVDLNLFGVWTNDATTVLTIKVKLGSVAIAILVNAAALTPTLTAKHWQLNFRITCRTTGVTGTVYGQGSFSFEASSASPKIYPANSTGTVTIDTTASAAVDATAQWGTATSAVSIQADVADVVIKN